MGNWTWRMCYPQKKTSKSIRNIVVESRKKNLLHVDLCDGNIYDLWHVPGLFNLSHITQLALSHNKLTDLPPCIVDLRNLEVLNVFNNYIAELPSQICSLKKAEASQPGGECVVNKPQNPLSWDFKGTLIIMNRMSALPQGFGPLPSLEILDLSYNNLSEASLPSSFFYIVTLRALYLSENNFKVLPPDIGKLNRLQILCLRDNDLISLPKEVGDLAQLKELHIQGNWLSILPPQLGNLDLTGPKHVFKAENNPWVIPIASQLEMGTSSVFEYIRSETYKYMYDRHMQSSLEPPEMNSNESKKTSCKTLAT